MTDRDNRFQMRWAARVAFALTWLFAAVTAYFWAHKPFDSAILLGLARSLAAIGVWLGVTWLGMGLGRRLMGELLANDRPAVRLVFATGVGLGTISLLMLFFGLIGLLQPVVVWGALGLLGAVLWPALGGVVADLRAVRWPRPASSFQRWVLIYGALSLLMAFALALAPPAGWDTLVYHLTGPRLFVEAGRIVHPIDLPYLGFPQLGEMHFTLALLLGSERAAPLFHFGYGTLALAVTVLLARSAFGRRAAWLAAMILLSVPTLLSLMARAYVDLTLMCYATLALYAFLRWREQHRRKARERNAWRWLALTGLFCGFCGGVKYTAVAVPFALGLNMIVASHRDGMWPTARRLALIATVVLAALTPGLVENWLTTGNPVYPFFSAQGRYWDAWRVWWYDRPGTGFWPDQAWRLLTAPVEATVLGTEGSGWYDATVGPFLLPAVALLVLVWHTFSSEERAIGGHLLLFFGLNYLVWLVGLARTALLRQTRLLVMTFGAVATLGGVALARLDRLRRPALDVGWLVRATVSLALALLLFSLGVRFLQIDPLPVLLGLESHHGYLTRRLGWYHVVVKDLNQRLSPEDTVLFLWEPRAYHCQVDCRPDALLDRFLHATHRYGYDAEAIAAAWRAQGISYVLLYQTGFEAVASGGFDPLTEADRRTLTTLQSDHLSPLESWGGPTYILYTLD